VAERKTPLLEAHRSLGARLTEFAGWNMPLQYEGVVTEHRAVRSHAGVFDVSHLGKLRLGGPGARAVLDRVLTADLATLEVGRAAYGFVLKDDGGCLDDVFVYRLGESQWLVVPNAANVAVVKSALHAAGATDVEDAWDRWAILALQGPSSTAAFESVWPSPEVSELKLHTWRWVEELGADGFVARTGYTGERGYELYVAWAQAEDAFERLLDAGCTPVGLGARDTLRLEMGYALHGHELGPGINPLEAGLAWAIAWNQPFRGRDSLLAVRGSGPSRSLFGIRCSSPGVPRRGCEVLAGEGVVGKVTSGNFSPTLGTGIALALGPAPAPDPGAEVAIRIRGRLIEGAIVKPPFIKRVIKKTSSQVHK
jgi:aminomethyltransferase